MSSLIEGRDLVKRGLQILLGNGSVTNLWNDPWLSTHPPRSPRPIGVSDLMNDQNNSWDADKIAAAVHPDDRTHIHQLRLSSLSAHDLLGWHCTSSSLYIVTSGYWLTTHFPDHAVEIVPPSGLPELKERIWKLKTVPKIKHFLWRILSDAMAIGTSLVHRSIITDSQCRRCCKEE